MSTSGIRYQITKKGESLIGTAQKGGVRGYFVRFWSTKKEILTFIYRGANHTRSLISIMRYKDRGSETSRGVRQLWLRELRSWQRAGLIRKV